MGQATCVDSQTTLKQSSLCYQEKLTLKSQTTKRGRGLLHEKKEKA